MNFKEYLQFKNINEQRISIKSFHDALSALVNMRQYIRQSMSLKVYNQFNDLISSIMKELSRTENKNERL